MFNILGVQKESTCCPSCKDNYMRYEERSIHIGKFCNNCGRWIKWVSKSEVPVEFKDKVSIDNHEDELDKDNSWTNKVEEEDDVPWF